MAAPSVTCVLTTACFTYIAFRSPRPGCQRQPVASPGHQRLLRRDKRGRHQPQEPPSADNGALPLPPCYGGGNARACRASDPRDHEHFWLFPRRAGAHQGMLPRLYFSLNRFERQSRPHSSTCVPLPLLQDANSALKINTSALSFIKTIVLKPKRAPTF